MIRIRNFIFPLVTLVFLAFSLAGCVINIGGDEGEPIDPANSKLAMIFGYIDMEDAPSGLGWVSLKRYKPAPNHVYYAGVDDGLFWHLGLEMGSYQVDQFGKEPGFFSNTRYSYNFGASGRNQTARRIRKPGIYYLGSYQYRAIEANKWYLPDKFEVIKTSKPSEKELLTRLLKIMREDSELKQYKHQISWITQRLARLK